MSNYLKFLHELAAKGPTGARVFSTAVISGSSSAPNLKEMPAPNDNAGKELSTMVFHTLDKGSATGKVHS